MVPAEMAGGAAVRQVLACTVAQQTQRQKMISLSVSGSKWSAAVNSSSSPHSSAALSLPISVQPEGICLRRQEQLCILSKFIPCGMHAFDSSELDDSQFTHNTACATAGCTVC